MSILEGKKMKMSVVENQRKLRTGRGGTCEKCQENDISLKPLQSLIYYKSLVRKTNSSIPSRLPVRETFHNSGQCEEVAKSISEISRQNRVVL